MQANHLDIPGVPSGFAPRISNSSSSFSSFPPPRLPLCPPSVRIPSFSLGNLRCGDERVSEVAAFSLREPGSRFAVAHRLTPPPRDMDRHYHRKKKMGNQSGNELCKPRKFPREDFGSNPDSRNYVSNDAERERERLALNSYQLNEFHEQKFI